MSRLVEFTAKRDRYLEVQRRLAQPQEPETVLVLRAELLALSDDLFGDSAYEDEERGGFPCIC